MPDRPRYAKAIATEPLVEKWTKRLVDGLLDRGLAERAQEDPERATYALQVTIERFAAILHERGLFDEPWTEERSAALARELIATLRGERDDEVVQDPRTN